MEDLRLHQINDVKLVGRVTRDPDIKYTARGDAFLKLTLAINRNFKDKEGTWQEETTFVPLALWREAAQRCYENTHKGSPIYIEGRLRSHRWETEEKVQKTVLEVDVRRIQFLSRKKNNPLENGQKEPSAYDSILLEPIKEGVEEAQVL